MEIYMKYVVTGIVIFAFTATCFFAYKGGQWLAADQLSHKAEEASEDAPTNAEIASVLNSLGEFTMKAVNDLAGRVTDLEVATSVATNRIQMLESEVGVVYIPESVEYNTIPAHYTNSASPDG